MHQIARATLLLLAALTPARAQSAVSSQRLNFAYTYGRPDYVDLSALGANVFPATVAEPMVNARNLKSFAINYRGWRLFDEYIVDPEFFWELDPVALKGRIRTVSFARISKYPSLVARYRAIRPTGVNFITCVDLDSSADDAGAPSVRWSVHQVCFRAQSYQMFWGASRSARAASYPGALLGWKEGVSMASLASRFTPTDDSDVARMRTIVSRFRRVARYSGLAVNTWLDIRWPDEAIDRIYDDFQEYERVGKDLERAYREARTEPAVAPRQQVLAAGDEMAQPFEDVPRVAQYFTADGMVGLKDPDGRTLFRSSEYSDGGPFGKSGKFFWFRLKGRAREQNDKEVFHLLTARGRRMTVGGYDAFAAVGINYQANRIYPREVTWHTILQVDTDEILRRPRFHHQTALQYYVLEGTTLVDAEARDREKAARGERPYAYEWVRAIQLVLDDELRVTLKRDLYFERAAEAR